MSEPAKYEVEVLFKGRTSPYTFKCSYWAPVKLPQGVTSPNADFTVYYGLLHLVKDSGAAQFIPYSSIDYFEVRDL